MSKKSKKNKSFELDINISASQEEPQQKKKFHHKDLIQYQPLTPTQNRLFDTFKNYPEKHLALLGSAGTGKTFCALFLALDEYLLNDNYDHVIIIRSAVPTRSVGFLPGSEEEKTEIFELPYHSICNELFKTSKSYENLKKLNIIKFITTSYIRGLTFDNSIIIVDECQNFSWEELYAITTRVGIGTRIIFCGDTKQNDLRYSKSDKSGFDRFRSITEDMDSFEVLNFTSDDIVRSGFVKEFIIKSEQA